MSSEARTSTEQSAAGSVRAPVAVPRYHWYHKLGAFLFITFCFTIGLILLVFPWLLWWDQNYLANIAPPVARIWTSPHFRGAVSGIGLLNIYISIAEIVRLKRFVEDVPGTTSAES